MLSYIELPSGKVPGFQSRFNPYPNPVTHVVVCGLQEQREVLAPGLVCQRVAVVLQLGGPVGVVRHRATQPLERGGPVRIGDGWYVAL